MMSGMRLEIHEVSVDGLVLYVRNIAASARRILVPVCPTGVLRLQAGPTALGRHAGGY